MNNTLIKWFNELKYFAGVKTITSGTNGNFYGCSAIEKIKMPPYLVSFGSGYSYGHSPFKDNTKITELLLPDTVTSRCDAAFAGMSGLRRLRWSSGMPFDSYNSGNYRGSTFYNCVNLSTIENLSGVTVQIL